MGQRWYENDKDKTQHFNSLRPSDTYIVSKLIIIGSNNGLSPDRRQVIIWTNARILLIRRNKLQWNLIIKPNLYIFIEENAFESVCEMTATLSRPQCVKVWHIIFHYIHGTDADEDDDDIDDDTTIKASHVFIRFIS